MIHKRKKLYKGQERRRTRRKKGISVIYRVVGREDLKAVGFTENISAKGIYLNVTRKLEPRTELFLKMNLPNSCIPIQFKGRVVWVKRIARSLAPAKMGYELGIKFIQISDNNLRKICRYVLDSRNKI